MKPLNSNESGCNPISSNCVIWQGPDIKCINLCKGDTITDVVNKLATELCTIWEMLQIDGNYVLPDCIASGNPVDFKELIQLILNKICTTGTTGLTTGRVATTTETTITTTSGTNCPDCTVEMASCFTYVDGFGNTITQAQLVDYVSSIANRICVIITEINNIQVVVNSNTARIVALENTPAPIYTPPTVTPQCVLPSVPTQMESVLNALEGQFCQLRSATGTPTQIISSVAKQCAGLNTEERLAGIGTMATIPGWATTLNNMSDAFGNMWLTICDMRTAIRNIQLNCCPSGCDGIELDMVASLDGTTLRVYITGTIPTGFVDCGGSNNIKVTDSAGNSITVPINVVAYLNFLTGFPINLSLTTINTALDLTVEIEPCLTNSSTNATCKSCLSYTVINLGDCPVPTFFSLQESITFSFTSGAGSYTYTAQLYDATGTILLQSQTFISTGATSFTGTFSGLTAGTTYRIRIVVSPTACPECPPTECPFFTQSTVPNPCPPVVGIATSWSPIIL
jgi:hypothetical protein